MNHKQGGAELTIRKLQMRVQIQRWREHKKDTLIAFFNIELSGQIGD